VSTELFGVEGLNGGEIENTWVGKRVKISQLGRFGECWGTLKIYYPREQSWHAQGRELTIVTKPLRLRRGSCGEAIDDRHVTMG